MSHKLPVMLSYIYKNAVMGHVDLTPVATTLILLVEGTQFGEHESAAFDEAIHTLPEDQRMFTALSAWHVLKDETHKARMEEKIFNTIDMMSQDMGHEAIYLVEKSIGSDEGFQSRSGAKMEDYIRQLSGFRNDGVTYGSKALAVARDTQLKFQLPILKLYMASSLSTLEDPALPKMDSETFVRAMQSLPEPAM